MLMHLHIVSSKCNRRFLTLKLVFVSIWIAHAFIHACWYSSDTSSHSREAPPYLMSFWHHHTILYPLLTGGLSLVGSMAKMIFLYDDEEPIQKVLTKSNRVYKFAICSMFCSILASFNMLFYDNEC